MSWICTFTFTSIRTLTSVQNGNTFTTSGYTTLGQKQTHPCSCCLHWLACSPPGRCRCSFQWCCSTGPGRRRLAAHTHWYLSTVRKNRNQMAAVLKLNNLSWVKSGLFLRIREHALIFKGYTAQVHLGAPFHSSVAYIYLCTRNRKVCILYLNFHLRFYMDLLQYKIIQILA